MVRGVGVDDGQEAHLCDVGDAVEAELLRVGEEDRQAVGEVRVWGVLGFGVLRRAAGDDVPVQVPGHAEPLWSWVMGRVEAVVRHRGHSRGCFASGRAASGDRWPLGVLRTASQSILRLREIRSRSPCR